MKIINANNTKIYKPKDERFQKEWINFWKIKKILYSAGIPEQKLCAVEDCENNDLVGAHVIIAEEYADMLNQQIADMVARQNAPVTGSVLTMRKNLDIVKPNKLNVDGVIIAIRNVPNDWKRAISPDQYKQPMFIAALCDSCNKKKDTALTLKPNTILIPLYANDQIIEAVLPRT